MSHYKDRLDELSGVRDWIWHDLRRTGRSLMSRARVDADIAEKCLGHLPGLIRVTYDRYSYITEKTEAFERLAGLIELILNPPPENVVELRKASNG
jgi:hypothetical protein